MRFGGRVLPLPAGSWRVVASLPTRSSVGVTVDFKALASESAGGLVALVLLTGNDKTTPGLAGYRADGNCERSDMIFTNVIHNEDFGDQDCQYIDFLVPEDSDRAGGDSLVRAALGDLKERGIALPKALVGANFRFGDRTDLLIAKFWFNPEAEGIAPSMKSAWLDNDWNKYNLAHHEDKQRYVEHVKAWLLRWETIMRAAWNEKPFTAIDDHDRSPPGP